MNRIVFLNRLLFILLAGVLSACTSVGPTKLFRPASPHEQYAKSLRDARLERTALGTDWLNTADRALKDSVMINAPYRESGYFAANRPFALGYRLNGQRGDKFIVKVDVEGQEPVQLFIDIFELNEANRNPNRLTSAKADTNQLTFEVLRTRTHLIRIQPELLRSGRYTISITREPILGFPVQGRDSRQISSYFGASRDAGRRRHEGIDIFAPRGTPALAASDGYISGVGTNNLGGNVVYLSDSRRNQTLYYAHLDSQAVQQGRRVSVGDTVGFIGNTGNARTTAPHLHFGIYSFNSGAVDPLPFVRRGTGPARQTLVATETLGDSVRISATRAVIRQSPDGDAPILRTLPRSSAFAIAGGTATWLRVELPDGTKGYVSSGVVEPARRALRRAPLPTGMDLLEAAGTRAAVIETLSAGTVVEVLGVFGSYQLVRHATGLTGWLSQTP
ncbi:SH3 domain-containing protein [Larkinella arboricola]|uniref:SH3 domain-containing protein n=1 Tax=Larkinella arboricola TaxID=643671 RepID=A0A327X7P5_LARAB|nr:peptidoglycan DD-metalloendopeptidase family protein [Larkinella arboricola]RAK03160.1 SH3 domain-containing protein [Larkinella arboricola]